MLLALLNRGKRRALFSANIVQRLLYTNIGQIVISILFGLALAFMFQRVCKENKCVVIEPPPMDELKKYVYRIGNDCYKYVPRVVECPPPEQSNAL